ncbi:hypothetical protein PENTCL1PPCAC_15030, partial [Pristionchus entomophagus]
FPDISLTSHKYLQSFDDGSSKQLSEYFPHQIDCDRVFSGDVNYTKNLSCESIQVTFNHNSTKYNEVQARFASAPSFYEPYTMAYAKIVYKDYQFLEQQMWNTYTRRSWYCFSIDLKASENFRSKIINLEECLPNVITGVSRKISGNGLNQNYAHLDCMRILESKKFEYVFLLQNHDILTRTHKEFARILSSLEGSTVVDKYPCPSDRCLKSYPTNLGQLELCPTSFTEQELSSCEAGKIRYMKGGMQALLPKAASDSIVNVINATIFIDMYTKRFGGDETFFPSITTTEALKIPGRYTAKCGYPRHLRYVIWWKKSKCASGNMRNGVCVFGLEDIPTLKTVPQFLMNKMMPSFDYGVIQCFNELLLKRNLGIEPSYDDVETFASGDYARFQRELRQPNFDPDKFVCNSRLSSTTTAKPTVRTTRQTTTTSPSKTS